MELPQPKLFSHFKTAKKLCKTTHNYNNFVQGICVWIGATVYNNNIRYCQFWLRDINQQILKCTLQNDGCKHINKLLKGNCYQISNYILSDRLNIIIDQYTKLHKTNDYIKTQNNKMFIIPHKRIPFINTKNNQSATKQQIQSTNSSSLITDYFKEYNMTKILDKNNDQHKEVILNENAKIKNAVYSKDNTKDMNTITNIDNKKKIKSIKQNTIQCSILNYVSPPKAKQKN